MPDRQPIPWEDLERDLIAAGASPEEIAKGARRLLARHGEPWLSPGEVRSLLRECVTGGTIPSDGEIAAMPDAFPALPSTRVEITGKGAFVTELKVGGHTLPATSAVLRLDAGSLPELQVTLPIVDGMVITLNARTKADGDTRDALMAMGWTPPADDFSG